MSSNTFTISGRLIDILDKRIYPVEISVVDGIISSIKEVDDVPERYIMPGFIDAHVHIESSMLIPTEFARLAVVHGTVATASDPHEIANVCGVPGVQYMIDNSKKTPFNFFFGAPSCVPATFFETAGAHIDSAAIEELMDNPDIWYLAEMMNYPGVLNNDKEIRKKIAAAKRVNKPVDGHAPGLRGQDVAKYAAAGISTDHECFTMEEALDKIKEGMHIIIREGSAAKNFEALAPLIPQYPDKLMFCSDDKHPDELVLHHINELVKRALQKGYDIFDVLRIACINPILHYNIPVGMLRVGDKADFIVASNLDDFTIERTYLNGQLAAENRVTLLKSTEEVLINKFNTQKRNAADFVIVSNGAKSIRVIEALEGQLITNELVLPVKEEDGFLVSNTENDALKICVVNRYTPDTRPAVAFIKNFGLKQGALASTIAHDCHNIIVVGVDDASIAAAVNALIEVKGGIAVAKNGAEVTTMALPVGGLMSNADGYKVAEEYSAIDRKAKELGTTLHAPFMTLSFMALLVIPDLKLSDKGLFSGKTFSFTPVQV
ncbi:MAG: adenine deaminase [Sphingobacteriales bacterium]|nr:MAG: adenine deaminase [Sphingobacteriales bacterium]